MNFSRSIVTIVVAGLIVFITGCISQEQYDIAMSQNRTQAERIVNLESQLKALEKRLEELESISATDSVAKNAEIALLKKDIENKKKLIEKINAQLLRGGLELPFELTLALQ